MRTRLISSRPKWDNWGGLAAHAILGAAAGMLLLHPLTKAIYAAQWHDGMTEFQRIALAFSPRMLPMTGAFALLGAALGLVFAGYHRLLARQRRALGFLEAELERSVPSLLAAGESEHVEFKAAARWDVDRACVNREIESAIVRTIAGFLNHAGGSLLIGVTDDGRIAGLEADYRTLHDPDRDGFERFVMSLVRTRLGGHVCPLVHVAFHRAAGQDVCRVIVEPAAQPVYLVDHGTTHFVVRVGNSTRELDVREAMEHIERRFAADVRAPRRSRRKTLSGIDNVS
jgi:hypothetical protein